MPMITVRYVTPTPQPELRAKIAELVARLGDEKLGKDPGVTAVLIEPADRESWFIAGKHPTEANLAAFWLDMKITAGTNTKGETTAFVRAAYDGMRALLGPLARGMLRVRPRNRRRRLRLRRPYPERPLGGDASRLTLLANRRLWVIRYRSSGREIASCPQCPESDAWPSKRRPSRWARKRHSSREKSAPLCQQVIMRGRCQAGSASGSYFFAKLVGFFTASTVANSTL